MNSVAVVTIALAIASGAAWMLAAPARRANETTAAPADRALAEPPRDYDAHVAKLKKKLPDDSFFIVVEKPFVVIGNEDEETVRRRAENTVRWAVNHLKKDYFTKDPDSIIDIWLFKDAETYEANAKKLFGSKPTTPYGYYTREHNALVMNISTGGGTLVHEIVHPFIASNFPECPSWFNEGLASLYEQSGERNGRIRGEVNWRLPGLQETIKKERLPTFETLCATTTTEFYSGDHSASNYGQARYLCYYLQEQGKLVDFYHAFRKNAARDKGGYETLAKLLDEEDMPAFQKRWEAYVTKLKYR